MLLPKFKLDIPRRRRHSSPPNLSRRRIRPTEINPNLSRHSTLQRTHISLINKPIPHRSKETSKIRPPEIRPTPQLSQRIETLPHGVQVDIRRGVVVQPLREIRMDAQELCTPLARGRGGGLRLQRGEEGLEPLKGGSVLADPDELDTTQSPRRVGARAQVPDVFEDRGPGGDADAGADEDGDFVLEDVFGGGSVGPVDAEGGHHLPVLERDFVHTHWIEAFEVSGLRRSAAESVSEAAGEVADLPDVYADVWVEGTGCDGKGVPLGVGDFGDLEEEPLAGFVFHAWFAELDLHCIWGCQYNKLQETSGLTPTVWMTDHLRDHGPSSGSNFSIDPFQEVETTTHELPSPALVANTMVPEFLPCEWRDRIGRITHEAAGCVGIESEHERDEQMVCVPKGFERLLPDSMMRGCIHQHHAQEHDMAGYPPGLGEVDLESLFGADLVFFNVEEAGMVRYQNHESVYVCPSAYLT